MIKLKLKNTEKQIALVKQMASRDASVSRHAREVFAAFVGEAIEKVLPQASTAAMVYTDMPFNEDDSPSFPVDLWYDANENFVQVWSQSVAGGLPSSHLEGLQELKFHTYSLDSAVSIDEKYARRARLDVVSKAIERMLQEIVVKQNHNGWSVLLKALAEASTNSLAHVITATTTNIFQLDDMNRLLTRARRINTSWTNGGGTPASEVGSGLTDLFVSPEIKEQIRGFAYQPMNTRTVDGSSGTPAGSSTAMPLPDGVREDIYRAAGSQEIYGVGIIELNELGDAQRYNTLFDAWYTGSFTGATDQIVVGVDLSREAFIRPVAQNAENGATFIVTPDDQWVSRSKKLGWYGGVEEGRVCIDARAILGIIV